MKRAFIVPNPKKDSGYEITAKVCDILVAGGCEAYIYADPSACSQFDNCVSEMPENCDVVIVIGGDGSFIDASFYAIDRDIPIVGVNLGRTGFLSEIEPTELDSIRKILDGDYKIENKMLLSVSNVNQDGSVCSSERLAVNDIVISHTSYMGVAEFLIYTKDGGIRYRADGVVVSTPAGSTAYSLSAGGPVVSHGTDAMIVTPIAPHSLFNRSIVFSGSDEIWIKNIGSEPLNISVDGRLFSDISPFLKCKITASQKRLKVLTFKGNNMFSNLFSKIQVVEDVI